MRRNEDYCFSTFNTQVGRRTTVNTADGGIASGLHFPDDSLSFARSQMRRLKKKKNGSLFPQSSRSPPQSLRMFSTKSMLKVHQDMASLSPSLFSLLRSCHANNAYLFLNSIGAVEAKCRQLLQQASAHATMVQSSFNNKLANIPRKVRDMTLNNFVANYGSVPPSFSMHSAVTATRSHQDCSALLQFACRTLRSAGHR